MPSSATRDDGLALAVSGLELAASGLELAASGLELAYGATGAERRKILDIPLLTLAAGARIGITGASGAGKSSLLHALTGIERPTAGRIVWDGIDVAALPEAARDAWRRRHVGLVFQDFHLMPGLSILGNVLLPVYFEHLRAPACAVASARSVLAGLSLPDESGRSIAGLSRGERQRVAVARALAGRARLIVADEPTASLDAHTGRQVIDALLDAAGQRGATLIVATHDPDILARLTVIYRLDHGRLVRCDTP